MKIQYAALLFLIVFGCTNYTISRKTINYKGATISWFSEEYGDGFTDIVSLKLNNSKIMLMEALDADITNLYVREDTVFIKMYSLNQIYFYRTKAHGFYVKIDSTATYRDWLKVYQPDVYKKNSISDSDIEELDRLTKIERMKLHIDSIAN